MSRPDAIDPRFDDLVSRLREVRVGAPDELRERVSEIASRPAPPPPAASRLRSAGTARLSGWFPRLPQVPARRAVLVLVPAVVAVGLASAVGYGLATSGGSSQRVAAEPAQLPYTDAPTSEATVDGVTSSNGGTAGTGSFSADATGRTMAAPAAKVAAGNLPATPGRAQRYEADLTLRVEKLSQVTKRVLALTRSYGGYLRTVDYGDTSSTLVLRLPVGSVQEAIVRLTSLGEIVSQHVSITDVQPQIDKRFRELQGLRAQIGKLQAILKGTSLSKDERAGYAEALAQARLQLTTLQRVQAQQLKRVSFATVSVGLQTQEPAVVVPPGRIHKAFDNAWQALEQVIVGLVYALVVGGPLLLVGAVLLVAARRGRRRADERLLSA